MSGKRYVLTMQDRLNVLKDLEALQPVSTIATKYNVHATTIRKVRRNAAIISQFAGKDRRERERHTIRKPLYEELEKRLHIWFIENQTSGNVIKDALLLEKAAELKKSMRLCSKFKVSAGWLAAFKRRNNIRLVHTARGEPTSDDVDMAKTFVENLKQLIKDEKINLDNIYKMDVSNLLWKALSKNKLAEIQVNTITDYKIRKERLTMGLCANASGNNKLMPLIICLARNPRALKHCRSRLPVIFKSHSSAQMNRDIFIDWFESYFKPQVQAYQLKKGITGKVLLLLDSCEKHKVPKYMKEDPHFNIICLPPYTASIVQSTDQRIVDKVKKLFRQQVLQGVLNYEGGVIQFYKDYTIKNCIDILHKSWAEITVDDIKTSWPKILAEPNENLVNIEEEDQFQCEPQHWFDTVVEEPFTKEYITILPSYEETISKEYINIIPPNKEPASKSLICEEQVQEDENNVNIKSEDSRTQNNRINEGEEEQNNNKIELKYLLDRLAYHTEEAPSYIKLLVESIRLYFREQKRIHCEEIVGM